MWASIPCIPHETNKGKDMTDFADIVYAARADARAAVDPIGVLERMTYLGETK
jgi:hypothetical protein